jgi:hypothetical protein
VSTGLTIGVVVVAGVIIAGAATQYPEIKRYLKIRSM